MSQTTQQLVDEYLLSASCATAAEQIIALDPQYGNIRMTTPIGRLSYVTVVKPRSVQQGQEPKFSATILLNPAACGDLWKAIVMVANNRWKPEQRPNPQNPTEMVTMTGEHRLYIPQEQGGLHNPLRNGNQTYSSDPVKFRAYLGTYTINAGIDAVNRKSGASQQPLILDEDARIMDPGALYSGAYGRLQITIFAYPQAGTQSTIKPGIGVLLNAIQFARHGEKLSGFDALKSAQAAFGTLPKGDAPQPGFGPNHGVPFAQPGGIPAGFAQPPAQVQQAAAQPQNGAGASFQPPGMGGGVTPWNTQP